MRNIAEIDREFKEGYRERQEKLGVHWIPGNDPVLEELNKSYLLAVTPIVEESKAEQKAKQKEIEAIERGEIPPSKKHQRQCIVCLKDFEKPPGRGRPPKKCPECRDYEAYVKACNKENLEPFTQEMWAVNNRPAGPLG